MRKSEWEPSPAGWHKNSSSLLSIMASCHGGRTSICRRTFWLCSTNSMKNSSLRSPAGAGWIPEIKHDGFRLLARRDARRRELAHNPPPAGVRIISSVDHQQLFRSHLFDAKQYFEAGRATNDTRASIAAFDSMLFECARARRIARDAPVTVNTIGVDATEFLGVMDEVAAHRNVKISETCRRCR
jgi:hypothetical protein